MIRDPMPPPPHSGHDFGLLRRRWEELANRGEFHLSVLCQDGDLPVMVVENEAAVRGGRGGLYLSAGVHGDECAPVWALLHWAEQLDPVPRDLPLVIFPCLNPHGLVQNTRLDRSGTDLNRAFGDPGHPLVKAWHDRLEGRHFDLAVNLHEDFDATGIYLYELTRGLPRGEGLLTACEAHLPRERSAIIDGSEFRNGHLVRTGDVERVVEDQLGGGFPEAIYLFLRHAAATLTFETPSEADLSRRIAAQRAFIEALVDGEP